MKILQVITSLSTGGAERMLCNVALGLDCTYYTHHVVSLTDREPVGSQLEEGGIPVTALHGRGGLLLPYQLLRINRICKAMRPDLIHAWMYHANLVGHFLRAVAPRGNRPRLIISVRGAVNAPQAQPARLRLIRRIDGFLSSRADAVLFNSKVSAEQHFRLGYSRNNAHTIPNGFDAEIFRPDRAAGLGIRREIGIADEPLIGLVARFNELKGHRLFLSAAADVLRVQPNSRFALVGRGCDKQNKVLENWISELGLAAAVSLLGERSDMPAIYNALDVTVCASISESFPNAIGEAMACGIPCVVTEVGDCPLLVGDAGIVVPSGDWRALAAAVASLATMSSANRRELGAKARERIRSLFSLASAIRSYGELYELIAGNS